MPSQPKDNEQPLKLGLKDGLGPSSRDQKLREWGKNLPQQATEAHQEWLAKYKPDLTQNHQHPCLSSTGKLEETPDSDTSVEIKLTTEQPNTGSSARSLGSGVSMAANLREILEANPGWKSVEIGGKVFPNPALKPQK